jgi:hypothetical protein
MKKNSGYEPHRNFPGTGKDCKTGLNRSIAMHYCMMCRISHQECSDPSEELDPGHPFRFLELPDGLLP